jgi:hypothetical protein
VEFKIPLIIGLEKPLRSTNKSIWAQIAAHKKRKVISIITRLLSSFLNLKYSRTCNSSNIESNTTITDSVARLFAYRRSENLARTSEEKPILKPRFSEKYLNVCWFFCLMVRKSNGQCLRIFWHNFQ